MQSAKAFFVSFLITLCLIVPLSAVVLYYKIAGPSAQQAAASPTQFEEGGPVRLNLLFCVVGQENLGFLLVRLDSTQGVTLCAIPQESVVLKDEGSELLAQSYRNAGPARACQRLEETLGIAIDGYLALTPSGWGDLTDKVGKVQYSLSGCFTPDSLAELELEAMQNQTVGRAEETLLWIAADSHPEAAIQSAAARGALWNALFRTRLAELSAVFAEGIRGSSTALTDLNAQRLLRLEQGLARLARSKAGQVTGGLIPGDFDPLTGRYEFTADTVQFVQSAFSANASGAASDSGREP